jgi:hypothetical protein
MSNQNLLDLLTLALPYVEDCAENPAYKPAAVQELADRIRAAINASDWDYYEFSIGEHFVPAIINGDYTGLNDTEERQLDKFLAEYKNGHWGYDDLIGFSEDCRTCEVCDQYTKTMQLRFHFKQSDRG